MIKEIQTLKDYKLFLRENEINLGFLAIKIYIYIRSKIELGRSDKGQPIFQTKSNMIVKQLNTKYLVAITKCRSPNRVWPPHLVFISKLRMLLSAFQTWGDARVYRRFILPGAVSRVYTLDSLVIYVVYSQPRHDPTTSPLEPDFPAKPP